MLRKVVCPLLLMSLCLAAKAEVHTWTFTYTGFQEVRVAYDDDVTSQYLPGATIVGSFTGSDTDADGAIELAEISSLIVHNTEYVNCALTGYNRCGADGFTFSPDGGLDFSVYDYAHDPEYYVTWENVIASGVSLTSKTRVFGRLNDHYGLYWTPHTTLNIMSHAPEPATYAMFGAGLLVLAGLGARRRRLARMPGPIGEGSCRW